MITMMVGWGVLQVEVLLALLVLLPPPLLLQPSPLLPLLLPGVVSLLVLVMVLLLPPQVLLLIPEGPALASALELVLVARAGRLELCMPAGASCAPPGLMAGSESSSQHTSRSLTLKCETGACSRETSRSDRACSQAAVVYQA
jgi:hypothetical protein